MTPMKARMFLVVLVLAVAAAACGGDESADEGVTGSDELGSFTVVVQDPEGGNTLSFSGISCDGLSGPFEVTIAVEGGLSGETTATLELPDGSTGTLDWSMEVTGAEEGTLSGVYSAEISPLQDADMIVFRGVTKAETASGTRTFDVETADVPVDVGTGACPSR
jgi:hypothetical protein